MATYTITLNDAEEKALLTNMKSIQEWIDNAIHNKARICIDQIVEQIDVRQVNKIPVTEKHQIVRGTKFKTAIEKWEELQANIIGQ